jgi:hypothetical protein
MTIFALGLPSKASAMSMGDAAMTVTVSTVAGAVLGASTLPFYEDSGKHSKNIFYGAAFGAVVGVLIAAYSGVQEGSGVEDEEVRIKKQKDLIYAFTPDNRWRPEQSSAINARSLLSEDQPVFGLSVAALRF